MTILFCLFVLSLFVFGWFRASRLASDHVCDVEANNGQNEANIDAVGVCIREHVRC